MLNISQSEFQKVYAPFVLGVRPSAHLPPTTGAQCEFLVLSQWPQLRLLVSILPNSPSYLETMTGERSECGSQDGGEDDEDTFAGLESRGMGGSG